MQEVVHVLVVDDERVVRDGCHRVLSGRGYRVSGAENGHDALEILRRERVDLMLLDLKMPGMSGEEVLEKAREDFPEVPVIVITGHGTVDTAVECMKRGAYDFITKPFQLDPFLITVRRAAEKRRLEEETRRLQEERARDLYDLALEKSRLKTIINCMANGVMVTNRNLEVVLHNPALLRLLEIPGALVNPVPVERVIRDETFVGLLKRVQEAPEGEEEVIAQELRAGRNVLRAISAPAKGPEGEKVGGVTVLEDITAFKQLDQMKSDFVNMVAHELRSPLVSIRQQNTVILDGLAGPLQEKQRDLLQRGTAKIDGLLTLINDLLDIARIEAGMATQHQVPTDLEGILQEVVELMRPRAEAQGVEIHCTCMDLRPVQADPKHMEEVFSNLITNAVNYSPDGGVVSVTAKGLGEYVEIAVSDTGIGIDPEELPKIFDKFYRVKHPRTRQVMGTGLGLSIVKGVVEAHRGTIDVESRPGEGTTFRVLLPVIA